MLQLTNFSPQKPFTRANSQALTSLENLSYQSPSEQQAQLSQNPDVVSFHFLDSKNNEALGLQAGDTGTQVSLVETQGALLLAARGTPLELTDDPDTNLQWQDLASDLDARPVSNYDGSAYVPAGFKHAADGIWEQVKPHLEKAVADNKPVHMTGHSLGASIATYLADRMHQELHQLPVGLLTQGPPDPGWGGEKQHLEDIGLAQRTVRLVNNIDPIPGLVPGGRAVGTTVYFDSEGQARVDEGWHLADRAAGLKNAVLKLNLNPLQDHYPQRYEDLVSDPRNAAALDQVEALLAR